MSGTRKSPFSGKRFRVTSPYGYRAGPFGDGSVKEWHGGLDLVGIDSKDVVSVTDGRVLVSQRVSEGRTAEWGEYVAILADGAKEILYYCHLAERRVSAGDSVTAGQVIGREGATGKVTGAHLHFEVRDSANCQQDAAAFLGIENKVGEVKADGTDYASLVAAHCGFEEQTVAYLNRYEFADDLWRKLWLAMDGSDEEDDEKKG